MTNTFAGIRPADVAAFVPAEFAGALAATVLFRWLMPQMITEPPEVLVRQEQE
jgi:hypothetical protein